MPSYLSSKRSLPVLYCASLFAATSGAMLLSHLNQVGPYLMSTAKDLIGVHPSGFQTIENIDSVCRVDMVHLVLIRHACTILITPAHPPPCTFLPLPRPLLTMNMQRRLRPTPTQIITSRTRDLRVPVMSTFVLCTAPNAQCP